MTAFLSLHIAGGSLAVVAGYAALFASKGGRLHRRAGVLFVYAMIAMGAGAVLVGLERGNPSWLGGPMVIYLVVTSMLTVSRTQTPSRTRDIALMVFGLVLGLAFGAGGFLGLMGPGGPLGAAPAIMSLVYAFVLLLCVAGDVRMLRSGPPAGTRYLARHLWRMSFAMFAATGSFFLGQPQVIPEPLRIGPLLFVLAFLPLPIMFYWLLWRVRRRTPGMATRFPRAASSQKVAVLQTWERTTDRNLAKEPTIEFGVIRDSALLVIMFVVFGVSALAISARIALKPITESLVP